jgi:ankyrin repeat protein
MNYSVLSAIVFNFILWIVKTTSSFQLNQQPTLQVFNNFFSEVEITFLHQLAESLQGESMWYTPNELLILGKTQPVYKWIHDIVLNFSGKNVRVVEIWSQQWSSNIEWHTDKDEELYHRNRVLKSPEKSFVAYIKNGRPETRGLLICSTEDCKGGFERISPLRGRLVMFDPALPHRAENPFVEGIKSNFFNARCPGLIHHQEEEIRSTRSLLFNAWTKHIPEAITNASSRSVLSVSQTGGWTATGPFNDGPSSIQGQLYGRNIRQNSKRRLRPGIYNINVTLSSINSPKIVEKVIGKSLQYQQSILHYAAKLGKSTVVRDLLIQSNVFVDYVREDGTDSTLTPLHAASTSGDVDTVEIILSHCCQGRLSTKKNFETFETLDRDGKSSLHLSVLALARAAKRNVTKVELHKYRKVVDLLANAGSHATPITRKMLIKYWGSVMEGAENDKIGKEIIMKDINDADQDLSYVDDEFYDDDDDEFYTDDDAFYNDESHELGQEVTNEIDTKLKNNVLELNVLESSKSLDVSACIAAETGDIETMKNLLHSKIWDIKCLKHGKWNVFMVAACYSHSNIVELLVNNGADPNYFQIHETNEEKTSTYPIHCAGMRGDIWTLSILLKNHANVDATDRWGRTSLHIASEQIQPIMRVNMNPPVRFYQECIDLLLEYNATIDLIGYSSMVPSDATTRQNLIRAGVPIPNLTV